MLFLAGADHERYGKVKWTRQINLQSATVSLQVVISLCKRKETAALKFKAAVSYRFPIYICCNAARHDVDNREQYHTQAQTQAESSHNMWPVAIIEFYSGTFMRNGPS